MASLLEIIEQNRKQAGAGNPVSAPARTGASSRNPIRENLYSSAANGGQRTLTEIIQQNREQKNLYAQAAQSGGTLLEIIQQNRARQGQPNLYAQATQAQNTARGSGGLFGDIYDKADDRQSGLYTSPYAEVMGREDYAEKSRAGESKIKGFGFGNDERYDYQRHRRRAPETGGRPGPGNELSGLRQVCLYDGR